MPVDRITTGALYVRDSSPDESPWTCNGWDMALNERDGEIYLIRESEGSGWSLRERMEVVRDDFEDLWSPAPREEKSETKDKSQ